MTVALVRRQGEARAGNLLGQVLDVLLQRLDRSGKWRFPGRSAVKVRTQTGRLLGSQCTRWTQPYQPLC